MSLLSIEVVAGKKGSIWYGHDLPGPDRLAPASKGHPPAKKQTSKEENKGRHRLHTKDARRGGSLLPQR